MPRIADHISLCNQLIQEASDNTRKSRIKGIRSLLEGLEYAKLSCANDPRVRVIVECVSDLLGVSMDSLRNQAKRYKGTVKAREARILCVDLIRRRFPERSHQEIADYFHRSRGLIASDESRAYELIKESHEYRMLFKKASKCVELKLAALSNEASNSETDALLEGDHPANRIASGKQTNL